MGDRGFSCGYSQECPKGNFIPWAASEHNSMPKMLHHRTLCVQPIAKGCGSDRTIHLHPPVLTGPFRPDHPPEMGSLPLTCQLMSAPYLKLEEPQGTPYEASPSPNNTGWQTQGGTVPLRQQAVCNDNSSIYSTYCAANYQVRK